MDFIVYTLVGSIAAGGRYDNLIGIFGSKQVPAVLFFFLNNKEKLNLINFSKKK
jgi:hypothetical protein